MGSIQDAELAITKARFELPAVFGDVIDMNKKPEKRSRLDEDDGWQERSQAFKSNSLNYFSNPCFFVVVMLSRSCRAPLDHFIAWIQKHIKIHKARLQDGQDNGNPYLGPTPLSDLATKQQAIILAEFNDLLLAPIVQHPWSDIGCFVGKHFPAESDKLIAEAKFMIVTQMLILIASWNFRYTERLTLWLPIFELVAKEPGEACDKCKQVAAHWLGRPECCLKHKDTDIFVKLRKCFPGELAEIAKDGRVPLKLFDAMLLIRAQLPLNVQDTEGMNSILQVMGRRAHNMMVTLASDIMQLKNGEPITADECTSLHDNVMVAMSNSQEHGRFLPVLPDRSPSELDVFPCPHVVGATFLVCARLAHAIFGVRHIGASCLWSCKRCFSSSFIMC